MLLMRVIREAGVVAMLWEVNKSKSCRVSKPFERLLPFSDGEDYVLGDIICLDGDS